MANDPLPGADAGTKTRAIPDVPKLMAGKRGLIMGVANNHSIAWGIAQALHGAGAELAFTYQGAAFGKRVLPMVEKIGGKVIGEADVENGAVSTSWSMPSRFPTRKN
jgi:enoyl-[acyl-carrier protein] reductase I